jgi:hypothetical protein
MKNRNANKLMWLAVVMTLVTPSVIIGRRTVTAQSMGPPESTQPLAGNERDATDGRAGTMQAAATPQLVNPGFEGGWEHTPVDVYTPYGGYLYTAPFGEIFVPDGWGAFFRHGPPVAHDPDNTVGWAQPEVHVINREPPFLDPPRVYAGDRALKLFTFWKIHDAGLYQQVRVPSDIRWRLSGWVHAWTSEEDKADQSTGEPLQAWLMVGLDPTGGKSPYGKDVVWGEPAHVYDDYARTPAVEATSQGITLTAFIRSWVLWPYKHNDIYWDEISLEPVYEGALPQLTAEPVRRAAYQGESVIYDVSLGTAPGITSQMTLSMDALSGAKSTFKPVALVPGGTATLVVTPSLGTPAGTYAAKIDAKGTVEKDGITYPIASTGAFSLTVKPADFGLRVLPNTATILKGGRAAFEIELASPTPGFDQPVKLSAVGLPTGTMANFSPAAITQGVRAALLVTTTQETAASKHEIVIRGTAGELQRETALNLEVRFGAFLPLMVKN